MFEKFKQRRAAHEASTRHDAWAEELASAQRVVELARNVGSLKDPGDLLLHAGEALIGTVGQAGLIEEHRQGGHYVAGSQGVSIPIGTVAGRSVRYRVGRTKGHYVPGALTPTAVDHGPLYITDQRIVFVGAQHTKECRYDKIVSLHHTPDGVCTIGLSGRVNNVMFRYGGEAAAFVDFCLNLGLARFHGHGDEFLADAEQQVKDLAAAEPATN